MSPICQESPQGFLIDVDRQFAEYDRANEKDQFKCCIDLENASIGPRNDSGDRNKHSHEK
jgi:hypothetical protein